MAIRRSFSDANESDAQLAAGDFEGQPVGTSVFDMSPSDLADLFGGDAGTMPDPNAGARPGEQAPDMPPAPPAPPVSGGEGNRESPRQTFDAQQPRTPVAPAQPNLDEIMAMLPQGVEAQPSAEQTGMGAGSVPGIPPEPTPTVMRHLPPAQAMGGSEMGMGGAQAPQRNTFESPSALFAGGGAGKALGQVGGFSLPGQSQGPPQATKQMLEMLKQLTMLGG